MSAATVSPPLAILCHSCRPSDAPRVAELGDTPLRCDGCGQRGYGRNSYALPTTREATTMPTADQLRERAKAKLTGRELQALRVELRRELQAELAAQGKARAPRVRELPEVASAARRMIRAVATRAGGDVDGLPELAELRDYVDEQLREAIAQLRTGEQLQGEGYSWADIGARLGLTRQAVQQRFGR